jgi:hypothetical protein
MRWVPCTGDACVGDTIRWTEAVWPAYKPRGRFGRRKTPLPLGERTIVAEIVRDSYGKQKQQHTFTLCVIAAEGYDALEAGKTIQRKGRTLYRNGTERQEWTDEAERANALADKHNRGNRAREQRAARRELNEWVC